METTDQILDDIKKHIDEMSHQEDFTTTGKLLVESYSHLRAFNTAFKNTLKKQNNGTN